MHDIQFRLLDAPVGPPERPDAPAAAPATGEGSFTRALGTAVDAVDKMQVDADQQADAISHGGGNLHEVAIAFDKADIAMRLASKVRNKIVDAYNEIMKMSV